MTPTVFAVNETASLMIDAQNQTLIVSGSFMDRAQLDPLKDAIDRVRDAVHDWTNMRIDMTNSLDCVSMHLKVFLQLFRELPGAKSTIFLKLAEEDGYLIPWHETVLGCINHNNPGSCQVQAEVIQL